MQVLKGENDWSSETLTQEQFLERLERAFAPNLRIHLL
jgi:hypothetical protein